MNRRNLFTVLGCLAISAGLGSSAEAGGRPRPRPTPKPPAATRVTVINNTARSFFTDFTTSFNPNRTVAEAQAAGAKVVNAGATAVFTTVTPGENEIVVTDTSILNLNNPNALVVVEGAPSSQQFGDFIDVRNKRNTVVTITQPAPNGAPLFDVQYR